MSDTIREQLLRTLDLYGLLLEGFRRSHHPVIATGQGVGEFVRASSSGTLPSGPRMAKRRIHDTEQVDPARWEATATPACGVNVLLATADGRLVAAGPGGIAISTDLGASWRPTGIEGYTELLAAAHDELWIANMHDGLFVLVQEAWHKVPLPSREDFNQPAVEALFVDPAGSLWISLHDALRVTDGPGRRGSDLHYVLQTQDRGKSWQERLATNYRVTRIAMTPTREVIVAGNGGAQRGSHGSWHSLTTQCVHDMVATPDRLLIATPAALFDLRGAEQQLRRLPTTYRVPAPFLGTTEQARDFCCLAPGRDAVYVGSGESTSLASVFRLEHDRLLPLLVGAPSPPVRALTVDPSGVLFAVLGPTRPYHGNCFQDAGPNSVPFAALGEGAVLRLLPR